jgi:hypothetical protein
VKRLLLILASLTLMAACTSSPTPAADTTTTPTRTLHRPPHHKPKPHPSTTTTTGPVASTTTAPNTTTPPSPGTGCQAGYLPDPRCTPGATNPAVTQATLGTTACKRGWTSTIRPPVTESNRLKVLAAKAYGITDSLSNYEGDHLVPLELGGAPDTPANLWDEPHTATGPDGNDAGSLVKDAWENHLNFQLCRAHVRITLAQARAAIVGNWYAAYTAAGRPPDPYGRHH